MIFSAEIKIMPLKELLDPQGKAILGGLANLGLNNIRDVRMGKHILLQITSESKEEAFLVAQEAATKLLASQVMEEYTIEII